MLEIHQANTLNSGNCRTKFILHPGIVTRLRSHHFQALPSFTTLPHSTWHQASNQALVGQLKDIRVIVVSRKDTTSQKWLLWTSNVHPSAIDRRGAVISRRTSSASNTSWNQSRQVADIVLSYFIRTNYRRTWETTHYPSNKTISADSVTAQDKCGMDCEFASITR